MSQFGVSIQIKDLFFDRAKVIKAMDRAERRALSKAGAFIRTAARSSIKTRSYKFHAAPGQPPFDHTGFALQRQNRLRKKQGLQKITRAKSAYNQGLRAILFGYDDKASSVVIGPLRFGGSSGSSTVAAIQEHGGQAKSRLKKIAGRMVTIEPRPFMAPALKKELPNLPQRWRSSIGQ